MQRVLLIRTSGRGGSSRGDLLLGGLHDKRERFLLLVVVVVEVPELLLSFPPFDNSRETGNSKKHLDVPVAPMPIRMLIPSSTDFLDSLDIRFTELRLSSKLLYRHVDKFGSHADNGIKSSHDHLGRIVDEYS